MSYSGEERRKRNPWPLVAFIVLALFAGWANWQAVKIGRTAEQAAANIEAESKDRRHQICLSSEREHLDAVVRLRSTYAYLEALPAEELNTTFNKFILRNLPRTEREAATDVAPEFCDEPNIGLPEPDPVVPKRPAFLDKLLGK